MEIINQNNNFQNSENGTGQNFNGANIGNQNNYFFIFNLDWIFKSFNNKDLSSKQFLFLLFSKSILFFLLIGLFHLPEAILLIMDGISLDSILYLIGNILLCLLGIYQLKFRSREMRYLPTKSVIKEKNYSFNLKYLEPLKEMIESGNFSNKGISSVIKI